MSSAKSIAAVSETKRTVVALESRSSRELRLSDLISEGKLSVFPFVEAKGLLFLQFRKNEVTVSAGPFVGLVPLTPRLTIDIKPKLPVSNMTRVLDVARSSLDSLAGVDRPYLVQDASSTTILKFVAGNLIEALQVIAVSGIHKAYSERVETTSQPRGRIDVYGTIRDCWSRGQKHQVRARRFEQSPDVAPNRVLKAALEFILVHAPSWSTEASSITKQSNELYREFPKAVRPLQSQDIGECEDIIERKSLPVMRSYYYRALEIAILILRNKAVALQSPGEDMAIGTFIINFEELFERYLRRCLQDRCKSDFWVRDGNREGRKPLFDDRKDPPAQPDIVVIDRESGRKVVAEVKYKEKPNRDDINQAITYALSFKTSDVVLVHQRRAGRPAGLQEMGRVKDIRLRSYAFDLASADLELEEDAFASCIFGMAGSS